MLNKQIILKDNSLKIGNKELLWDEIRDIREYNSKFIQHFSIRNAFPRIELFLNDGKVISIDNGCQFINHTKIFGKNDFETFRILLNKKINLNYTIKNWLEWRLILPAGICEILMFVFCIVKKVDFDKLPFYMFFVIVVGVFIGFIWERRAKRNFLANLKP